MIDSTLVVHFEQYLGERFSYPIRALSCLTYILKMVSMKYKLQAWTKFEPIEFFGH